MLRLTVTENFAIPLGRETVASLTGDSIAMPGAGSALLPLGRRIKRVGLEARFDAARNAVVWSSQFINSGAEGNEQLTGDTAAALNMASEGARGLATANKTNAGSGLYYVSRLADTCIMRAFPSSNGMKYVFSTASPPTAQAQGQDEADLLDDDNRDGRAGRNGEGSLCLDIELPSLSHVRLRDRQHDYDNDPDGMARGDPTVQLMYKKCARVPPLE